MRLEESVLQITYASFQVVRIDVMLKKARNKMACILVWHVCEEKYICIYIYQ